MPRPWRIQYAGAKYHVTARGNGRQRIFFGAEDYERFQEQLQAALERDEVILYAYALMPNHYHLFVETPMGNIQKFMQRLNTAYSMYFRYKHSKPGHCLQGRYSAKLIEGDDYIVRLTRYIHLNPVMTRSVKALPSSRRQRILRECRWSSYRGYTEKGAAEEMVDYRWLGLMERKSDRGRREAYRRYVEGMIGGKDDVLVDALQASRYAIGEKQFIQDTEAVLKELKIENGTYGDIRYPDGPIVELKEIEGAVADEFGVEVKDLRDHGSRGGVAKSVAIELCCRLSGKTQREIAKHYAYKTDAGVSRQRRVLREKVSQDAGLRRQVERLKKRLVAGNNNK